MRIIAGDLRGRSIKTVRDPGVRPISGRIKQSLFDIITGLVPASKFLDLFAGTGAVGIEALSRGAAFVFFVDMNKRCVENIKTNLDRLGFAGRARAHPGNVLSDLSWISFRSGVAKYDLIFLGPPYKTLEKTALFFSTPALAAIAAADLLAPGGWVISQHHVKEEVAAPPGYEMKRREKYGDTYLSFFKRGGN